MSRSLSFGITTGKDYFEELVKPSFYTLKANPLSYKDALSSAIFTWHLSDWVYASYKSKIIALLPEVKSKELFHDHLRSNISFQLIFQIATGAKHLGCNNPKGQTITTTQAEPGFFQGLLGLGTATHLTIDDGSRKYFFIQEVEKCIDWWDKFLKNIGIQI